MKRSLFFATSLLLISSVGYCQSAAQATPDVPQPKVIETKKLSAETQLAIRDAQHKKALVAQQYAELNNAIQQRIAQLQLNEKNVEANKALEDAIDRAYAELKLSKEKYTINEETFVVTEKPTPPATTEAK